LFVHTEDNAPFLRQISPLNASRLISHTLNYTTRRDEPVVSGRSCVVRRTFVVWIEDGEQTGLELADRLPSYEYFLQRDHSELLLAKEVGAQQISSVSSASVG